MSRKEGGRDLTEIEDSVEASIQRRLHRKAPRKNNSKQHLTQKNWTWLRKINLKKETPSFLIATQNKP